MEGDCREIWPFHISLESFYFVISFSLRLYTAPSLTSDPRPPGSSLFDLLMPFKRSDSGNGTRPSQDPESLEASRVSVLISGKPKTTDELRLRYTRVLACAATKYSEHTVIVVGPRASGMPSQCQWRCLSKFDLLSTCFISLSCTSFSSHFHFCRLKSRFRYPGSLFSVSSPDPRQIESHPCTPGLPTRANVYTHTIDRRSAWHPGLFAIRLLRSRPLLRTLPSNRHRCSVADRNLHGGPGAVSYPS